MAEYVDAESGTQKNNPSVESTSSTQKPPKYRLACDSCQHSKIRCDQKRPKCRRCAKKGTDCVYSPARRAGRPRTRNNNKNSQRSENSAPASSNGDSVPTTGSGITASSLFWMSPVAPHNIMSNTSAIPSMTPTMQGSSSDNMDFSPSRLSDDAFLHGLSDFTSSHCDTSKEMGNCHFSMSPEFQIAPEPLDMDFREATWEQQQQQQQLHSSTAILLDEGLPYCELLTPDDHKPRRHLDQQHEGSTTNSSSTASSSYDISPQQQSQPQFVHSLDQGTPPAMSCNCVTALFDHLSASSEASSTSCFASTPAALSTSRSFITSCRNTMKCPNACYMQPSVALVICEAINKALVALKLGGISLWTSILAPLPNYESGTLSPSSSLSCSTSSSSNNGIMLPSIYEEDEPLRCGTLPIQGADRRVMVRVLLVKRMLEMQGVLEQLQDMLVSKLLVSDDARGKKQLLALCANIVDESARKVAEKVEAVKRQM